MASLLAGKLADSFLATGNGDITVYIPSNVGVNIRAQSDLADSHPANRRRSFPACTFAGRAA